MKRIQGNLVAQMKDFSSVLCCCGSSVVVYSVKTGEQIQRLVEESEVISVVLNPKNPLQVSG